LPNQTELCRRFNSGENQDRNSFHTIPIWVKEFKSRSFGFLSNLNLAINTCDPTGGGRRLRLRQEDLLIECSNPTGNSCAQQCEFAGGVSSGQSCVARFCIFSLKCLAQ
jgi:hypothetical protein